MAERDQDRININTAGVGQLTQLPGIAKNTAYNIVNHRQRRGLFTNWEELAEVKEFPVAKLEQIKLRAALACDDEGFRPPRHVKPNHMARGRKKNAGYTRSMRATRRPAKMHDSSAHRPH